MTMPARSSDVVFRFDTFDADVAAGELRRGGARLKLQEQPWQVLVAMLEHAGRVVTRDELRERLWPTDTFVDFDHSLNIAVNKIRDALGDEAAKPRFVETVPRRGYRFIAPVERAVRGAAPEALTGRGRRGGPARVAILGGLLAVAVGGFIWRAAAASPHRHVIAVLPLRNLNPDPGAEYFSDGLTDELIYNLSIIDGLEVKSRTSSFRFKGQKVDIREAGRELQADLLLDGTLLREAGRIRLIISLVRAADDVTIWSQRYDREARDIFAVQDDISRAVVNELRLSGIGGQRRYSTDPDTYDLYLKAVSMSHENSPAYGSQIDRAIALLQQVTTRDPQFAPAYAWLASLYAHLQPRDRHASELAMGMRQAADRALALDPLLPQVQATVGLIRARDLRWQDAEAAFRRALELDPNLATARVEFATFVLEPQQRPAEALAQLRRAVDLDPLSPSRRDLLAFGLLRAGAYGEALDIARSVFAKTPDDGYAGQLVARALMLRGQLRDAVPILETLGPTSHAYLGYAYARLGRRTDAKALAAEDDPGLVRHQVLIYAALGDYDRLFDALQQLARANDVMADLYPGEPELAFLRDDPRMRTYCAQRGLPSAHP